MAGVAGVAGVRSDSSSARSLVSAAAVGWSRGVGSGSCRAGGRGPMSSAVDGGGGWVVAPVVRVWTVVFADVPWSLGAVLVEPGYAAIGVYLVPGHAGIGEAALGGRAEVVLATVALDPDCAEVGLGYVRRRSRLRRLGGVGLLGSLGLDHVDGVGLLGGLGLGRVDDVGLFRYGDVGFVDFVDGGRFGRFVVFLVECVVERVVEAGGWFGVGDGID